MRDVFVAFTRHDVPAKKVFVALTAFLGRVERDERRGGDENVMLRLEPHEIDLLIHNLEVLRDA